MRDARPRQPRERIHVERVAVVVLEQLRVRLGQDFRGDRLVLFGQLVRAQLVVREQHLRVEGPGDVVDRVLEEDDAFDRIGGAREHVFEEQRLAQRRGHLGDEDRVARVNERLRFVRQDRVHRMAHLVGRREHVVERVGVVEEHVRVRAVHRGGIRARALPLVLVHVDPAPAEALAHAPLIFRPERRRRVHDPVEHLFVLILLVERHQRNGEVVHVVRRNLQDAPPQAVVAAQRLDARARRLDQVFDDGRRDVVAVERGIERRLVAAGARLEPVALADAVVERGVRVQAGPVGFVQRDERFLAIRLLAARGEDRAILAVGDGHRLAVRQPDRRKRRVGRRERPVRVVGRRGEAARERHEPLAVLVEDVLLLAVEIFDREAVKREVDGLVHPAAHRLQRDLEQLRVEPRLRLPPFREQDLDLLALRVDRVVALILVVLKRRVIPHAMRELSEILRQAERLEEAVRSLRERSL